MKYDIKKQLFLGVLIILTVITGFFLFVDYLGEGKDFFTGNVVKSDIELVDVKIGYRGHLFYLPAHVAYVKGYFAEQGLNVELVRFDSTNTLVESVLTDKIDAGVGGVNVLVLLTIEQKSPGLFKIFNQGYYAKAFDALLIPKESSIKSLKDLEGKVVSSIPGTAAKVWINRMFEIENITNVKVVQTKPSQQLNVLASGTADAIFVLEPLVAIGENKNLSKVLVKSPITSYFMDDFLFVSSTFSTKFANKNPDVAKKIVVAVDKAITYINENPTVAKKYYSEFSPVDDDVEMDLAVPIYLPSTDMRVGEFQKLADRFTETGILVQSVKVGDMFWSGKEGD